MVAWVRSCVQVRKPMSQYLPELTVFFDGVCPMCSREIAHYRNLPGAEKIEWVNIYQAKERLEQEGLSFDDALALFHVRDRQGRWHIGVPGFIAVWSVLRPYRALGWLCRTLRLGGPLNFFYVRFAKWRLQRQRRCGDQCAPPK